MNTNSFKTLTPKNLQNIKTWSKENRKIAPEEFTSFFVKIMSRQKMDLYSLKN